MSKSSQEFHFIVRSANKHHVQLDLFSILEEHFCQNHLKNFISLLDQLTNSMYNWISFLYWRNILLKSSQEFYFIVRSANKHHVQLDLFSILEEQFCQNHLKNVISLLDQLTNIMYDWISFLYWRNSFVKIISRMLFHC